MDIRDLDQFVEINKEYGYKKLDGKKRINVRNSDDVTELLRRNYHWETGRTKAQLIPELPSTMEDDRVDTGHAQTLCHTKDEVLAAARTLLLHDDESTHLNESRVLRSAVRFNEPAMKLSENR